MSFAASLPPAAMAGMGFAPDLPAGQSGDQRFFDARESRPADMREQELITRLPNLVRSAKVAKGWAWLLSGVDARSVASRAALARLPVLRRHDLAAMQAGAAPFGGLVPEPIATFKRVFGAAGNGAGALVYEPEANGYDTWRAARALFAAGLRKGDVLLNGLSYHLEPAGFIIDSGCRAMGCPVIPAGPADSAEGLDQRLDVAEHLAPAAFAGTANLLSRLIERAAESGRPLGFRLAFIPEGEVGADLRQQAAARGIAVVEALTSPELGIIAYQTTADDGFVLNEDLLAEIVRPGTGEPVEPGEAGEVLLTSFDPHHPFIRLATGRLSRQVAGTSACGRTNMRLAGWLGSATQAARIGAITVTPAQIAELRHRHPGLGRLRLIVRQDGTRLAAETGEPSSALAEALAGSLRRVAQLAVPVELVAAGDLPNDGRVIADER